MFALRKILPLGLVALALGSLSARPDVRAEELPKKLMVYIGAYTRPGKGQGVYRMELDLATGKLSEPVLAGKAVNPSFLAIHPTGKYLYAVSEGGGFPGKKGTGAVTSFAIDATTGNLQQLNQQSSEGQGPCHLNVDRTGKYVLVANYGGGNAAVLPLEADGKLGPALSVVQHQGKGPNPSRQKEPHAHSINLDPANHFAFVADLGLDKVMIYRFEQGKLTPNDPAFVAMKPGAGPRHFAFHPKGKFAYVINELNSTVTAMDYDAGKGALTPIQSVTTLPEGYKGNTSTAEVVVHPSGKFLYGSNRGQDSIAVFAIDPKTGKLTPTGRQGKGVKTPRGFAVDPTGKFCLVANQDGGTVLVFRIDERTGLLEPTEGKAAISSPVCVRFLAWTR